MMLSQINNEPVKKQVDAIATYDWYYEASIKEARLLKKAVVFV